MKLANSLPRTKDIFCKNNCCNFPAQILEVGLRSAGVNGLVGSAANERKRAVKLIGEAVRVVRAGSKVIRRDPAQAFATKRTHGSTMVNRWRRREAASNRAANRLDGQSATFHLQLMPLILMLFYWLCAQTKGPNEGSRQGVQIKGSDQTIRVQAICPTKVLDQGYRHGSKVRVQTRLHCTAPDQTSRVPK